MGNRLDLSTQTEAANIIINVVVAEPKKAGVALGPHVGVAVVVTSAVFWVRKLADRRALELLWRRRRSVGYW